MNHTPRVEVAGERARALLERAAHLALARADLDADHDVESALRTLDTVLVPSFSDWCRFDVVEPSGNLRRVEI